MEKKYSFNFPKLGDALYAAYLLREAGVFVIIHREDNHVFDENTGEWVIGESTNNV